MSADATARGADRWLLYGAYGYTGTWIARLAAERDLSPVLAGRNATMTAALADELGLEHCVFDLRDAAAVRAGLEGVAAVLHCAGPFSRTWRSMLDACLATGTHYLDITGEIAVLEGLRGRDAEARGAGITVLPSVGFDVVPTDCAAALVASRVTGATHLDIAFHTTGGASRGTTRSGIEGLGRPALERRDGELRAIRHGSIRATIPFADRERSAVAIPWGDLVTAHDSTGIPNIRTFMALHPRLIPWLRLGGWLRPVLALPPVRALVRRWAERRARRMEDGAHEAGSTRVWARATNASSGESAVVELTTPDAYALTADAAVRAVERVAGGAMAPGFTTPALAFGPDFVGSLDGVAWVRGGP